MRLVPLLTLLSLMSCAGFKAVERGDHKHVFSDPHGTMKPTDPQDVITTESWEAEVAQSIQRQWVPASGYQRPVLQQTPEATLRVGEILEFSVDENQPVDVLVEGPLECWWNGTKKTDGWKNGTDTVQRESLLLVRGKKAGTAVLRVATESGHSDTTLTITP